LIYDILSKLDLRDLSTFARICKRALSLFQSDQLWKHFLRQWFGVSLGLALIPGTCKTHFREYYRNFCFLSTEKGLLTDKQARTFTFDHQNSMVMGGVNWGGKHLFTFLIRRFHGDIGVRMVNVDSTGKPKVCDGWICKYSCHGVVSVDKGFAGSALLSTSSSSFLPSRPTPLNQRLEAYIEGFGRSHQSSPSLLSPSPSQSPSPQLFPPFRPTVIPSSLSMIDGDELEIDGDAVEVEVDSGLGEVVFRKNDMDVARVGCPVLRDCGWRIAVFGWASFSVSLLRYVCESPSPTSPTSPTPSSIPVPSPRTPPRTR